MLIIIYVGAITVLFLFVIMMLDINVLIDKNNSKNFGYIPIIFLISLIFFLETFLMFSKIFTTYYHLIEQSFFKNNFFYNNFINQVDNITNIETIGHILYTYYTFFFLAAGIILLIALIGAVTLTKKDKKKQSFLTKNLYKQLSRNSLKAIFNIQSKN
jgi:NADH-quinone oxidoreductase subunit J